MKCEKKTFNTKHEAQIRLTEIFLKSERDEKPIRIYKCQYCNKYHLTSKSESQYNQNVQRKINVIKKLNDIHDSKFIRQESEYWEKIFNKQT